MVIQSLIIPWCVQALRVLAEHAQPETEDQIAAEVLNFVLAVPSSRKIAALAAKLASSLHPAFSGRRCTLTPQRFVTDRMRSETR